MNATTNPPFMRWQKFAFIMGGLLLVLAPLLIFLRANAYLNTNALAPLPTFPIDDGYIYSNYARHAAEGRWFAYQDSGTEQSGGVTSLLWYLLLTPTYWLVSHLFANLGVAGAAQFSVYILGAGLSAISAWLMYAHARLLLMPLLPTGLRGLQPLVLALPPILLLLLTPQATWAALSGLELPLSMALVLAALYVFLRDTLAGRAPGWLAAVLAALLSWARPELAAVALLLAAVAFALALRRGSWSGVVRYLVVILLVGGVMLIIYWLGTGRPLPSSFYAKSGQLALFSPRFSQAIIQLWSDGGWPFIALFALAIITGILAAYDERIGPARGLSLIAVVLAVHTIATSAATVWYGQMERYLLPVYPLALLLIAALPIVIIRLAYSRTDKSQPANLSPQPKLTIAASGLVGLIIIAGLLISRDTATTYAIQARNIADAHIAPAHWLAQNTPPDSVVATEPVGALPLFSARPTIDLVGLTTPAMLGHYNDWDYTWRYLYEHRASYMLYYPQWFKDRNIAPPAWLTPAASFDIPDNRIAGSSRIVLYKLNWDAYQK